MPLRNLAWLLVVPALVLLGLAISFSAPAPDNDYKLVRQVVDVLAEVDANYYRELSEEDRQKLVEDMINGGLHELDPHSEYLNEKKLKDFKTNPQGGGFSLSAFGGKPVLYKTVDPRNQSDYEFQRDFIFGTRLAWRMGKVGEIGVSYLQDGTKAAKDLPIPSPVDYTRKQVGADILLAPTAAFDIRGRTVFDVASHLELPGGPERSRIAEHDYTATVKLNDRFALSGNFAERNFFAYFAGTNLPSLFRQNDNDKFRGWGGSATWTATDGVQLVGDYRHMHRETFGDVNRVGGDIRWAFSEKTVLFGVSGHWVNASNTVFVDPAAPSRSLTHKEGRLWGMVTRGKFILSLDGILQRYNSNNPYLGGMRNVYETVASLGFQATSNIKVSGDISYGSTPLAKNETRGLLRAEYRFGMGSKGGR